MKIARIYLSFCLVASLIGGGAYLFAPGSIFGAMGIEAATPAGLTDLRASYAGFQLGMAGLLGWCLRDESRYPAGLVAFACVVGALAITRLWGLAIDGFSTEMTLATGIEFALSGFAIYSLTRVHAERD